MKISVHQLKKIINKILNESLDNKLHVVFLIGPPAVGKTTFLSRSKFKNYKVLSHDIHISNTAKKHSSIKKHIYSDHLFKPEYKDLHSEATDSFNKEKLNIIKNRENFVLDLVNGTKRVRDLQKKSIVAILLNKNENDVTDGDIKNNLYTTAIVFSDDPHGVPKRFPYSLRQRNYIILANKNRFEELDKLRKTEELIFQNDEEIKNRKGDIKNVPEEFLTRAIENLQLPNQNEFDEIYFVGIHPEEETIKN